MVRLALALVFASGLPLHAQPRTPSFLADPPATVRLDTLHLQAQVDGPVRAGADGRATVAVRVTPKTKMHVYAPDVQGYVPFTLAVQAAPGLTMGKVTYPPSETYVFPPTGESSRAYMRPFVVTQVLTISGEARQKLAAGGRIDGAVTVRYQACDDRVCYRPTSGTLAFEIVR